MADYSPREDLLRLYRRQGYERAPVWLHFCPALKEEFQRRHPDADGDFLKFFGAPQRNLKRPGLFLELRRNLAHPQPGSDGLASVLSQGLPTCRASSTAGGSRTSIIPIRST